MSSNKNKSGTADETGVGSAGTGPAAREGYFDPEGYDDTGADGSGIDVDAPERTGTVETK